MRATSNARAVCAAPSSIKQILAVVPPMSNDTTWSSAVLARDAGGKDRAARRAGFDQADRKADRGVDRGDAAARGHQQQRAAKARRVPARAQAW